MRKRDFK